MNTQKSADGIVGRCDPTEGLNILVRMEPEFREC